mmetsp:Transcript_4032/g.6042  ORF Transcript_4032/g.6042 Transcript_4032/m.6042 type:complete len:101 (+) Transcript_4032:97-399(+)
MSWILRPVGSVASRRAAIFGERNPKLNTGKRSGWKLLRNHTRVGITMEDYYAQPIALNNTVPGWKPDRWDERMADLAYRRAKGKPARPLKGAGARKTKRR